MLADRYTLFTLDRELYVSDNIAQTYTSVAGIHSGFIQPISGNEAFLNSKANEKVTHRLYTNVNSPAIFNDRVTQDGQIYFVVFAGQPKGISSVHHHKEILLRADF